jgi:hypothetical protein
MSRNDCWFVSLMSIDSWPPFSIVSALSSKSFSESVLPSSLICYKFILVVLHFELFFIFGLTSNYSYRTLCSLWWNISSRYFFLRAFKWKVTLSFMVFNRRSLFLIACFRFWSIDPSRIGTVVSPSDMGEQFNSLLNAESIKGNSCLVTHDDNPVLRVGIRLLLFLIGGASIMLWASCLFPFLPFLRLISGDSSFWIT